MGRDHSNRQLPGNRFWPIRAACVALALGLGALLAASACRAPDHGYQIAQRLIEEDAASLFQLTDLMENAPRKHWRFRKPKDLEPWTATHFDVVYEIKGRTLHLRSSRKMGALEVGVHWNADEVQLIEIQLSNFAKGSARLLWANADGKFVAKRSVESRKVLDGGPQELAFDVFRHPEWRGPIRRLRIEISQPQRRKYRIHDVLASSFQPRTEAVAAAAARSWKVEIDDERRNALLALPGIPVERRIDIPSGASLRFGYGADAAVRLPARVQGGSRGGWGERSPLRARARRTAVE